MKNGEQWPTRCRRRLSTLLITLMLLRLPACPPSTAVVMTPGEKLIALTFDDGPGQASTLRLLDGLRERGIHATFFLIGRLVEERGDVVLRIARDGHQIGIHTYDHLCMQGLNREEFFDQTERARRAVFRVLGERELWLRPPYGLMDANTQRWAQEPLILWSVDPEDWRDADTQRICRQITDCALDGDIILLHDIYESTVDAALAAVDALRRDGFCFVTVAELLLARGIEPELGKTVRHARI